MYMASMYVCCEVWLKPLACLYFTKCRRWLQFGYNQLRVEFQDSLCTLWIFVENLLVMSFLSEYLMIEECYEALVSDVVHTRTTWFFGL